MLAEQFHAAAAAARNTAAVDEIARLTWRAARHLWTRPLPQVEKVLARDAVRRGARRRVLRGVTTRRLCVRILTIGDEVN